MYWTHSNGMYRCWADSPTPLPHPTKCSTLMTSFKVLLVTLCSKLNTPREVRKTLEWSAKGVNPIYLPSHLTKEGMVLENKQLHVLRWKHNSIQFNSIQFNSLFTDLQ
jgi:hypothetical protein